MEKFLEEMVKDCTDFIEEYKIILDDIQNEEIVVEEQFDNLLDFSDRLKRIVEDKEFHSVGFLKEDAELLHRLYDEEMKSQLNYYEIINLYYSLNCEEYKEDLELAKYNLSGYVNRLIVALDLLKIKLVDGQKKLDKDENTSIQLLNKLKDTVVGGYITEYLFKMQFLEEYDAVSEDWWCGIVNDTKYLFHFCYVPSDFDIELVNKLKEDFSVWRVYDYHGKLYFYSENEKKSYVKEEFLKKEGLRKKRVNESNNTPSQKKQGYIDYLTNRCILSVGRIRAFVDDFLSHYFYHITNVDLFVKKEEIISAVEVKFKNESRDGYYGINKGEAEMYGWFDDLGIGLEYYILYKAAGCNDVLELLNNEDVDKVWYKGIFRKDDYTEEEDDAEMYTSFYGTKIQTYYKIPKNKFCESIEFNIEINYI